MAPLLDGILLDLSIFGRPTRCYLFISFAPSTSDQKSARPQHELQLTGYLQSPAIFQQATNQHFTPTLERWNACEKRRKKKAGGIWCSETEMGTRVTRRQLVVEHPIFNPDLRCPVVFCCACVKGSVLQPRPDVRGRYNLNRSTTTTNHSYLNRSMEPKGRDFPRPLLILKNNVLALHMKESVKSHCCRY